MVDVIVDLPGCYNMLKLRVRWQEGLCDLVSGLLAPGLYAEHVAGYLDRDNRHMLPVVLAFAGIIECEGDEHTLTGDSGRVHQTDLSVVGP